MALCEVYRVLKLIVIKFDKPARGEYSVLVKRYKDRLARYFTIQSEFISSQLSPARLELKVKKLVKANCGVKIICMDERGLMKSSAGLAKDMANWLEDSQLRSVMLFVGGPYGLPQTIKDMTHETWSLAAGVYPSDLAWLMLWEQLYRASAINAGTGYHHA